MSQQPRHPPIIRRASGDGHWARFVQELDVPALTGSLVRDLAGRGVDWTIHEVNTAAEFAFRVVREKVAGRRASEVIGRRSATLIPAIAEVLAGGEPRRVLYDTGRKGRQLTILVQPLGRTRFGMMSLERQGPGRHGAGWERYLLRAILEHMPLGLLVVEAQGGRILMANDRVVPFVPSLGDPDRSLADLQIPTVCHPDGRPLKFEEWGLVRSLKQGEIVQDELVRVPDLMGAAQWIQMTSWPVRDPSGRILAAVWTGKNVTREQDALLALRQSEEGHRRTAETLERSRALLDQAERLARIGSFEICLESHSARFSDQAFRVVGLEPGSGLTCERWRGYMHPADREQTLAVVEDAIARGEEYVAQHRIVREDGAERIVLGRGHAQRDETGRPLLVGTVQDITEAVAEQQRRLELEIRLQQAQKWESLSVLAGGVAHDFNNLLTAVTGYADLALLDVPAGSTVASALENIRVAADRAAELARQMLAYSGRGRSRFETLDLNEVVRGSQRLLEAMLPKKTELHVSLAPGAITVTADDNQLRQVVFNLVTNASEALDDHPGRVTIEVCELAIDEETAASFQTIEPLAHGRYGCIAVSDTGPGMDAETRARAFEPFFSTKFTGRGLGLATVLGIARGHRGAVRVDSEPGSGTRIEFIVPRAADPA